jgi:glycosyltransferase involved in cell wall biosynthesis
MTRKRLLVEGWRLVPHSYALVAQAHCLALLRRGDVELRFRDLPFHDETWRRTRGVHPEAEEATLAALPAPDPSFAPDITLHMMPDFSPPASGRKAAFGTPEFRVVPREWRTGARSGAEVAPSVSVVTPSRWTALAFERFGLPSDRIHVVPHGIDSAVFRPDPESRAATRGKLGLPPESFVFLNVGAMTDNKGIAPLLEAFARVAERHPHARLVLKGADAVYGSQSLLRRKLDALDTALRRRVTDRLVYLGQTLPERDLAALLRAADCYVSPYLAEGFNMPVLEAAACGVPVICTAGGPTDDFTDASFALHIRSRPVHVRMADGELGDALRPDGDHLLSLMLEAMDNPASTAARAAIGAGHVRDRFTWDAVTDLLVAKLFR